MADREKVIKELQRMADIINQYDDMFSVDDVDSWVILDTLPLLKNQEEIVRCKECRKHGDIGCPLWTDAVEWEADGDWFCADGERR